VQVRYRPYGTAWPRLGLVLGLLAVGLAAVVIWSDRKAMKLAVTPVKPQVEEPSYAPCAGCGFRLAEQRAPTAVTYPFNVVSCPICGLKMDDEGFVPGDTLGAAERERRLTLWLESHNYAPEQVYYKWGFGVDDFFDPEAVARGAPASPTAAGSTDAHQDPDRR
jgi:hypothetical protein